MLISLYMYVKRRYLEDYKFNQTVFFNFDLDHLRYLCRTKTATVGKHTRNRHHHLVIRPNLFTRILRFRVAKFKVLPRHSLPTTCIPLSGLQLPVWPPSTEYRGWTSPPSPKHTGFDLSKSRIIVLQGRQVKLFTYTRTPAQFPNFFFLHPNHFRIIYVRSYRAL